MTDHESYATDADATVRVYEDYFGTDTIKQYMMPDGVQFIEYKVLNEGERMKYQNSSNRNIEIDRNTNRAHLKMTPGSDRWVLLEAAVCGWNMYRNGQKVPFSIGSPGSEFNKWLAKAPIHIVDALENAIHNDNPWIMGDLPSEEIEKEIESLKERLEISREREAAKAASSNR